MNVEEFIELALYHKNEILTEKNIASDKLNSVNKEIKEQEEVLEGLQKNLKKLQKKISNAKENIMLAKGPAYRLKRELARLKNEVRGYKEKVSNKKTTNQRLLQRMEELRLQLQGLQNKLSGYDAIIKEGDQYKNLDMLDMLITISMKYAKEQQVKKLIDTLIHGCSFRIKTSELEKIGHLTKASNDPSLLIWEREEKIQHYLENYEVDGVLYEILLEWVNYFYKKRNPAREEGLREIERVKQLSPNWIYDSRKVMGLYKSLRGNSEFMLEELKDLKLMIETLLDEAKAWKKDKKQRWALKRCDDLENIIKSYPMYTRQLQGYIRPIEWIREELEQM